jgi:membrane-bound lytic murein transglycosylase A
MKSFQAAAVLATVLVAAIVGTLAGCASGPATAPVPLPDRAVSPAVGTPSAPPAVPPAVAAAPAPLPGPSALLPELPPADAAALPPPRLSSRARWQAVPWSALPGWSDDTLHEAWNAWIRSCERPPPAFAPLCPQVRQLSIATESERRAWMVQRLQPWRVEALNGVAEGLLTAYFEPVLEASRLATASHAVPLYRPPAGLAGRRPWYSRQEMETLPAAQTALRGQEIAFLADPLDALVLQIQGSGRLRVREPDGSVRTVRLAYAASNEHPYRSVGGWLQQQGALRDASWPAIKDWTVRNPQRLQEMLWSNPRTVFFREEPLSSLDAAFGPRGAQGVPLTPGRSIAVDRESIPYGTPVWLATAGPVLPLQRLVLAQDTGSAIVGAVRADYFMGWGAQAGEMAGRVKQPLRLWVLWPR